MLCACASANLSKIFLVRIYSPGQFELLSPGGETMCKGKANKIFFSLFCALPTAILVLSNRGHVAEAQHVPDGVLFEAATIKPIHRTTHQLFDPKHHWVHVNGTHASYWSMTVANLFDYAYGLDEGQFAGPSWTNEDRFDIEAGMPDGARKGDEQRMLQALLRDRFMLVFHVEKRSLESYALLTGPHGAKVKPSLSDPQSMDMDTSARLGSTGTSEVSSGANEQRRGSQAVKFDQEKYAQHWELTRTTMAELAARIGFCVDGSSHRGVDETGLKWYYQAEYDCAIPRPAGAEQIVEPDGGYLLTRSLDALGLKLEKRKAVTDVYEVDRVEKPSEN